MPTPQQLREKAQQCYRLATTVSSPPDYEMLLSLGAEAEHAADDIERMGRHVPIISGTRPAVIDGSAELKRDFGHERRRPGRQDDVSPHLIPLLRATRPRLNDMDEEGHDQLAPSRGVVTWSLAAAAGGVAVVALLLLAFWLALRGS